MTTDGMKKDQQMEEQTPVDAGGAERQPQPGRPTAVGSIMGGAPSGRPISPERWSRAAAREAQLMAQWGNRKVMTSRALQAKLGAEKKLRDAKSKAEKESARWEMRQYEKTRFTDEQRSWWDEEVIRQKMTPSPTRAPAESFRSASSKGGLSSPLPRKSKGELFRYQAWQWQNEQRSEMRKFDESQRSTELSREQARYEAARTEREDGEARQRRRQKEAWRQQDTTKRKEAMEREQSARAEVQLVMRTARERLRQEAARQEDEAEAVQAGKERQAEQRQKMADAHKRRVEEEAQERGVLTPTLTLTPTL